MDDEIANVLFGDFKEGDFEELNDEFVSDATKEPEDGKEEEVFDYDRHIRLLIEKARLEREDKVEAP